MVQIQSHQKVLTALAALKAYLQQEYKERLLYVILFGSQARGNATDTSDIDVLIVLQGAVDASEEIDRTSQFVAQICLEHNILISRLFLSRSRFETENSPLLRNIRREGVLL